MYYCEKCHLLSETDACDYCFDEKLREVKDGDYCFLIECEEVFGKMFEEMLQKQGIACAMEPVGNGVRSQLGLSLGNYKIFVPYQFYSQACDMLEFFQDNSSSTDHLKEILLDNVDKWTFETRSVEKKIRKKYKLGKEADVMEYVKGIVEHAISIEDVGLMYYGEHGLLVKSEDAKLWFSSESYKISI
ncbi:MAG: hypothetical protein IJW49_04010 [Clostridia bacterium]|nr:hypothetical protein [Clostridia bacterium]